MAVASGAAAVSTPTASPLAARCVIWDVDGTLLDTETLAAVAINHVVAPAVVDAALKREITGMRSNEWTRLIIDRCGLHARMTPEELHVGVETRMAELMSTVKAMPGVEAATALLAEAGIPQGVATSTHAPGFGVRRGTHAAMFCRMAAVVTGDQVARGKPEPDIFIEAAARLGVGSSTNCVVVEDSLLGVRAGVAAGMRVVAVPDPLAVDTAPYHAAGAELVVRSVEQWDVREWLHSGRLVACATTTTATGAVTADAASRSTPPAPITYGAPVSVGSSADPRVLVAPAADRNKGPISDVIGRYIGRLLPPTPTATPAVGGAAALPVVTSSPSSSAAAASDGGGGCGVALLEIASGTGQHCSYLVGQHSQLVVWPTDMDDKCLASITAYRDAATDAHRARLMPPQRLNVAEASHWEALSLPMGAVCDGALCVNFTHIAPWGDTLCMLQGVAPRLRSQGLLFVYGPFMVDGAPTTASNADFDASLKARNAAWGLRDVADVAAAAAAVGLALVERVSMPSNNFMLVFEKAGGAAL